MEEFPLWCSGMSSISAALGHKFDHGWAQWVKDPALPPLWQMSQLQLGSDSWPRELYAVGQPKTKKEKEKRKKSQCTVSSFASLKILGTRWNSFRASSIDEWIITEKQSSLCLNDLKGTLKAVSTNGAHQSPEFIYSPAYQLWLSKNHWWPGIYQRQNRHRLITIFFFLEKMSKFPIYCILFIYVNLVLQLFWAIAYMQQIIHMWAYSLMGFDICCSPIKPSPQLRYQTFSSPTPKDFLVPLLSL